MREPTSFVGRCQNWRIGGLENSSGRFQRRVERLSLDDITQVRIDENGVSNNGCRPWRCSVVEQRNAGSYDDHFNAAARRSAVFGLDAESRNGGRARSLRAGHGEVPGPGTGHRIRLSSVHAGHRLQLAASDTPRPRHTSLALKNGKSNAFANGVADTIELGSQVARSPIARSRVCLT